MFASTWQKILRLDLADAGFLLPLTKFLTVDRCVGLYFQTFFAMKTF